MVEEDAGPLPKRRRARGRRQWAVERDARADAFPPGPSTLGALGDWPRTLAQSLCKEEGAVCRLQASMIRGVVVTTSYSGMDCPREALRLAFRAVAQHNGWPVPEQLTFLYSCDRSAVCQRILVAMSECLDGGRSCVYKDI